ncbi:MAG: CBS domain-containing protein, partial [Actinobacteria bacterium]|nr:CBS domain-containing protein [Actinomycetota bacterium]
GKGLAYTLILLGIFGIVVGNIGFAWFILLGWYLLRAAEFSYQQVIYHEALEGVKVGQIMTENPETVDPGINVEEMVEEHFMKHNWVAYPVVKDGETRGIITIKSLENLPRSSWRSRRVSDVMRPLSPDIVTRPDVEVFNILPKLSVKAEGRMLVMEDDRLVGILTETDVNRAIVRRLHIEEETRRPAA